MDISVQLDTNKGNVLHWPPMAGSTVSSSNTVLCTKLYHESAKVYSSTVEEWRNEQSLKITEGYKPKNIYTGNETGLFFRLPPTTTRRKKMQ
jgi:hypothetical protein